MEWTLKLSDQPSNPDFPIVGYYETSPGIKSSKHLFTIEQIVTILQDRHDPEDEEGTSVSIREELVTSPILPEGTVLYAKHPNNQLEQIVFEIPQKTFDIQYKNTGLFHAMPFPRMLAICELEALGEQKKIGSMRIFALENNGESITEDTPLYAFPYTNVMKSSGSVCWGQNERVLVTSLQEVKKALLLFFSAPFNEDHGVRTSLGINEFKGLIKKLEDQPFSDEWLLPVNKTVGQMTRETSF